MMSFRISGNAECWLRTGRIGPLAIGCSVDEVLQVLGEPQGPEFKTKPDGFPSFWDYDDFVFRFSSTGELLSIVTSFIDETNNFIRFDWQGIVKGMSYDDCRNWLNDMQLSYTERHYEYGAFLDVESHVKMSFEIAGSKRVNAGNRNLLALTLTSSPQLKPGERLSSFPAESMIKVNCSEIYDYLIKAAMQNFGVVVTFDDGDKYPLEHINLCFSVGPDGKRKTEPLAVWFGDCTRYSKRRMVPTEDELPPVKGAPPRRLGPSGKLYGVENITLIWDYEKGYAVFEAESR